MPLLLSTPDAHGPRGALTILPLGHLSKISPLFLPTTDFSLPLLGAVIRNSKAILIHSEVSLANTHSLTPKILLTGQISASSRVRNPEAGAPGWGECLILLGLSPPALDSTSAPPPKAQPRPCDSKGAGLHPPLSS